MQEYDLAHRAFVKRYTVQKGDKMTAAAAAAAARRATRFISYLRVSTDGQGIRGLGMEAQRSSVSGYINRQAGELVKEFVEVESGKRADRPQLRAALAACDRLGARLVIAKLDRLSRSVSFISNLMEARADFVVVDMPDANRLTIHVMAAFAEHEREAISRRTKDALAAAKRRGVVLGTPRNFTREAAERGRLLGLGVRQDRSRRFSERMLGQVLRLRCDGLSLRGVAAVLNEEGVLTARGTGAWTACGVRAVLLQRSASRTSGARSSQRA